MKIIIISQERDRVIECKEIGLNDTDIYATTWVDEYRKVAEYESDKRAKEVFDDIIASIKGSQFTTSDNRLLKYDLIYEMPKE